MALTKNTATLIVMKDSSEYVFNRHNTLNIEDPMIYVKANWMQGSGGIPFSKLPRKLLS